MNEPSLLIICGTAFVAVMLLLSLLSGVISILMRIFPEGSDDADAGVVAAIHTVVAASLPGTRVTDIREVR